MCGWLEVKLVVYIKRAKPNVMTPTTHAVYIVTNKINVKFQVSLMSTECRENDMT